MATLNERERWLNEVKIEHLFDVQLRDDWAEVFSLLGGGLDRVTTAECESADGKQVIMIVDGWVFPYGKLRIERPISDLTGEVAIRITSEIYLRKAPITIAAECRSGAGAGNGRLGPKIGTVNIKNLERNYEALYDLAHCIQCTLRRGAAGRLENSNRLSIIGLERGNDFRIFFSRVRGVYHAVHPWAYGCGADICLAPGLPRETVARDPSVIYNVGKVIWLLGQSSITPTISDNGYVSVVNLRIWPNGCMMAFDNQTPRYYIHKMSEPRCCMDIVGMMEEILIAYGNPQLWVPMPGNYSAYKRWVTGMLCEPLPKSQLLTERIYREEE